MRSLLIRSPIFVAACWIGSYIFITLSPLLLLLMYPPLEGRGFWLDFSVALGFIGLAMMALQFALTARINCIEASYGIDIILQFHRYISIVAVALILIHPLILFALKPETIQLLNFLKAPWRSRSALLSTLAIIVLIVTTIWRQQLKITYELWRTLHGALAVVALVFGLIHVLGVGNYLGLFWKSVLWSVLILDALWLFAYTHLVKPWFMLKKPYLVEQVRPERGDVWTLALRPKGHQGFPFQPGQFAWMTLDISPYRMRQHPFSMSSCGDRSDIIAFSIKALGDFTNTIKDVKPGTKAYLDGPYGIFTTDCYQDSAGFVLIAGGIGITPMMSMLVTAFYRKDERPYLLIYASKSWDDITFREELDQLQEKLNFTIVHVLRNPPSDWSGETGYVDKELLERYIPESRGTRHYFICATPKMMEQVDLALHKLDVPVPNIHLEYFNLV